MNYIPKNIEFDLDYEPESNLLQTELNTIGSLKLHYDFKDEFKLKDTDIKWIENRINQLAIALFLDEKRILINRVGGYSGCPDKMIESDNQNGIEITILKFCYSYTENTENGEIFIKIFNDRMKKLMKNDKKSE